MGPESFETLRQNPFAWYQKSLLALVEGTQRSFRLVEANAQVVTRTAERVQASAEQTGQEIQETLTASVNRLKEIYARA
jgi:RecB family exonuclease